MNADQAVPSLMFFTLAAVLVVAVLALVWFLRKRSNREAYARAIDPTTDSTSDVAAPRTPPAGPRV